VTVVVGCVLHSNTYGRSEGFGIQSGQYVSPHLRAIISGISITSPASVAQSRSRWNNSPQPLYPRTDVVNRNHHARADQQRIDDNTYSSMYTIDTERRGILLLYRNLIEIAIYELDVGVVIPNPDLPQILQPVLARMIRKPVVRGL